MMKTRSFGRLAIGATLGVVLTIGATQAWQVTAAPGATDATFVAVSPCRLFDMRPAAAPATGKKTPLAAGAANIHTQQVTGNVGSCVGIPSGTVAVAMNVTIVDPTASSFLTVFPADQPQPNASSLNWTAGQAPTPNKVDVKLSADGKIKLFTESGTVNVIADVVGYYTPQQPGRAQPANCRTRGAGAGRGVQRIGHRRAAVARGVQWQPTRRQPSS